MALRLKRIFGILLILVVITLSALAIALSYDSPCEEAASPDGKSGLMKAVTKFEYERGFRCSEFASCSYE